MAFRRTIAALSLAALGSVVAAAPATAADPPTGVGSAAGGLSIVTVDYGDVLDATLVGEQNSDTIDPASGVPTAKQVLAALTLKSGVLPALDALSVTPVQTTSTGPEDQKSTALLDLSTLNVPGVVGTINPATLSSLVDAAGAKSTLTSTIANLDTLGVLHVDSANVTLGGLAGPTASNANRSLSIDALSVLNLQALLNLVGLSVSDLPLSTITGLLDQLGEVDIVNTVIGNTSFADATDLNNAVATANTAVDSAQTAVNTAVANVATQSAALAACAGVPACIAIVQPLLDAANAALTTANATLDAAQAALTALVRSLLDVLAGTPLLAVDGVTAGALARAADTTANSSATVTAAINDIRVGGLDLGGIDANTTIDQVEALATQITTTITGALGSISPELGNLLDIKLFQRSTNVSEQSGYVDAVADITAVSVTVTPPDVCALFGDLGVPTTLPGDPQLPPTPVNDLLNQLGSTVDVTGCVPLVGLTSSNASPQIAPVDGLVGALTAPLTLKAATVNSTANFKVVAAPVTPSTPAAPDLPRTGIDSALLLIFGGLMAAAALGLRRVSAPVRATTRRR